MANVIRIGAGGPRAIIAMYLDPEDAEVLAALYGPRDTASDELENAAHEARIALGEVEE